MSCTLEALSKKTDGFTAFPTGKSERWRFSHIKRWLQTPFEHLSLRPKEVPFHSPNTIVIENGGLLVQKLPEGIVPTADRNLEHTHKENPFSAFTAAFAPSLQLHCRRSLDAPLLLLYRYDAGIRHSSLNLTLEEGVEIELIEHFSGGGEGFITHHGAFELNPQSVLSRTFVQELDSGCAMVSESALILQSGAKSAEFLLLKGGAFHQHFNSCELHEKSTSALHALQLGREAQRQVLCTDFIHKAPSSRSSQLARQVLYDESAGVFDGKALIEQGAQGSVATQGSHALLLSDTAQIHAKPHLEIYTDDLRASHGSTVGELDEGALAYLQSRGIPEHKARAMMIEAFTTDLIESIANPDTKTVVRSLIGGLHETQSL